jgi:ComF family protein
LLDVLMPPACAGCGRSGALLCAGCLRAFDAPFRREDRFVVRDAGVVQGDSLTLAVAAFGYRGPVRRSLAALKYTGASRLAPILASAAGPALARLLSISGQATLVSVPVHRERLRERGYNQAELIARALAKDVRLPVAALLERVRPTTKQHRLDRAARLANLRGAFRVATSEPMPSGVVVVDDIITTTATVEACASVLREAGVAEVYGFAIAREV